MIYNFEGTKWEMVNSRTPPRREKIIQVILGLPHDPAIESELADFRQKEVKVVINIEGETTKKHSVEQIFTAWPDVKQLKNGNKLFLILTAPYDTVLEKKIIPLKFKNVDFTMETIEQELDFNQNV